MSTQGALQRERGASVHDWGSSLGFYQRRPPISSRVYAGMVLGSGVGVAYTLAMGRRRRGSLGELARQALLQEYPHYARIFAANEARMTPADVFVRVGYWTRSLVSGWRTGNQGRWIVLSKRAGALALALGLALGGAACRRKLDTKYVWWRAILGRMITLWRKFCLLGMAAFHRLLQRRVHATSYVAAIAPTATAVGAPFETLSLQGPPVDRATPLGASQGRSRNSQTDSVLGFADRPGSICITTADESRAPLGSVGDESQSQIATAQDDVSRADAFNVPEMPSESSAPKLATCGGDESMKNDPCAELLAVEAEAVGQTSAPLREDAEQRSGIANELSTRAALVENSQGSRSPGLSFETHGPSLTRKHSAEYREKDFCCSSNRNRVPRRNASPVASDSMPDKSASDSMEWNPSYASDLSSALSTALDRAYSGRSEMLGALAARVRAILVECTDLNEAERLNEIATLLQQCASARPQPRNEKCKQPVGTMDAVLPIDVIERLVNIMEGMIFANATLRAEAAAVRRELAAGLMPNTASNPFAEQDVSVASCEQEQSPRRIPSRPESEPRSAFGDENGPENIDCGSLWRSPSETSTTLSDMENDVLLAERVTQKLEQQVAMLTSAKRANAPNDDDDDGKCPLPAMLVTMNGSLHSIPRSVGHYRRG